MERISFQRSGKVRGPETLWLEGSVSGVMSSTGPHVAFGDGEAGAGSAEAKLATLGTWM